MSDPRRELGCVVSAAAAAGVVLLAAGPSALGLVALAGAGGLLATSGWARRLVAMPLVLLGALAPAASDSVLPAAVGGAGLLAAGLVTLLRAGRWPRLGATYDAPGPRVGGSRETGAVSGTPGGPAEGKGAWDALDQGEDPTR